MDNYLYPAGVKKDEKERFQEYVSSMLQWIIIVVVPTFVFLKSFLAGINPKNDTFNKIRRVS